MLGTVRPGPDTEDLVRICGADSSAAIYSEIHVPKIRACCRIFAADFTPSMFRGEICCEIAA